LARFWGRPSPSSGVSISSCASLWGECARFEVCCFASVLLAVVNFLVVVGAAFVVAAFLL
jgi:hypothetical protein